MIKMPAYVLESLKGQVLSSEHCTTTYDLIISQRPTHRYQQVDLDFDLDCRYRTKHCSNDFEMIRVTVVSQRIVSLFKESFVLFIPPSSQHSNLKSELSTEVKWDCRKEYY